MSVGHVIFNDQLPHGRKLRNFLNLLDSAFAEGNELLGLFAQMKDAGAVGQYLADKFGFGLLPGANAGTTGDVTVAGSAVAEIESVMGKMNTTGGAGVTTFNVRDAILQAIAKFG
jgi:hypothetical protein